MAATDRLHGKNGAIKMDPTGGATLVAVASLNKWDIDLSRQTVDVTAFGDTSHIYVVGLRDSKGTYGGWYDPADGLVLFTAIGADVPVALELYPDSTDTANKFAGKAYIDGKVSCDANGAVAISGNWVGAGPWTMPTAP